MSLSGSSAPEALDTTVAADCVVAVAPWDPTAGPPVHTQYPLIMVHTTV